MSTFLDIDVREIDRHVHRFTRNSLLLQVIALNAYFVSMHTISHNVRILKKSTHNTRLHFDSASDADHESYTPWWSLQLGSITHQIDSLG